MTWKSYGIKLWHENVENPALQDTINAFDVVDETVKMPRLISKFAL